MPMASAIRPTCRPMRPKPTIPRLRPASSISGDFQKLQSGLDDHWPSRTASEWSFTLWQSSSSSAKTNCATEAVP